MNVTELTAKGTVEPIPAATAENSALVHMIERAARDPSVDIDKLQRLMDMQERVIDRNARAAYAAALSAMQPGLPAIIERGAIKIGNDETKWQKYALWEDINDTIKPILADHGFALSFRTGHEDGKIIVTGILSHRDGHSEQTTMHLPLDTSGSKNPVQAVGSSTSYGKRYTAGALLNLTSRGEDDDGRAGGSATITALQLQKLDALATEVKADVPKFCKYFKIEELAALPAAQFDRAMQLLEAKRPPL